MSHEDAKSGSEDQEFKRSRLKPVKASEHKSAGAQLHGQVYFLHVPHAHVCDFLYYDIFAYFHCIKIFLYPKLYFKCFYIFIYFWGYFKYLFFVKNRLRGLKASPF